MEYFKELLSRMGKSLSQLIRAKIIATALSFFVLLVGFFLLDVEYWIPIAIGIAIVDLLPFVGGGIILIPWACIAILQSKPQMAIGLIIIFIITFLIHQIVEPLIIGKEVGIKPLYSFGVMVGSMILFGPWGALVGSLLTVLLSAYQSMKDYSENQ